MRLVSVAFFVLLFREKRGGVGAKRKAQGAAECKTRGKEILTALGVGWCASAGRGEEAGRFCKVVGVSIVVAGGPRSTTNTLTVDSQVA